MFYKRKKLRLYSTVYIKKYMIVPQLSIYYAVQYIMYLPNLEICIKIIFFKCV